MILRQLEWEKKTKTPENIDFTDLLGGKKKDKNK